jgi:hypothetical protein
MEQRGKVAALMATAMAMMMTITMSLAAVLQSDMLVSIHCILPDPDGVLAVLQSANL